MTVTWIFRGKWRLAFLCCLITFFSAPAFGFCFRPHASVACDFLNNDAVFTGRVISTRAVVGGGYFVGYYYRLRVFRVFRGPRKKVIEVYTANDSARYPLDMNGKYLIFASRNKGRLQIYGCDDNTPLSKAKDLIRKIERMKIPRDGIIEGRVVLHGAGSGVGVPGIQIIVSGKDRTYKLTTDRQGWFRIHVPPGGPYWVEAKSTPAHPIEAYDLNYGGNPNLFGVEAGKCMGFEFVANSEGKY